jgi:hypothetical protein
MRLRESETHRIWRHVAARAGALVVVALLFVSARPLPATALPAAAQDTSAALRRPSGADTAASDTAAARKLVHPWTMDQLKGILQRETGERKEGVYKEQRSGRLAMLYALLVPGLGQIYNEKPFKAAIAAGAETFYLSQVLLNERYSERQKKLRSQFPVGSSEFEFHDFWVGEYHQRSIDYIWWSGGVLFITIVDAYVDAHLFDMRFKVKPAASRDRVGLEIALDY